MMKTKDMESKGMSLGVSFGDRNPLGSNAEEKKEKKREEILN